MPTKDYRTKSGLDKGKDQGRRVVRYFTAAGKIRNAYVIDQGSSSGVKLLVPQGSTHIIVDNVPQRASAATKTNCYEIRHN